MSFGAPSERLEDRRTALAVQFARTAVGDPHGIPPQVWTELQQHFTERELVELCFVVGWYSGMQLVNILLDTDVPAEDTAGREAEVTRGS